MPDWTYVPLRRSAAGAFGSWEKSRNVAMRFIRGVARLPGGSVIIRSFDYTHDHAAARVDMPSGSYPSPIGVAVGAPGEAADTVFSSMGFGFAAPIDDLPDGATVTNSTTVEDLVAELDEGASLLVANDAAIDQGPAIAQRVNEVLAQRAHAGNTIEPVHWFQPWTWPAWAWAFWHSMAMICAGIGAALIALGPVMLGYDEDFLGVNLDGARAINDRLIPFLQHDRITMAGCMSAIGLNGLGFTFGMRRGWRWARAGFIVSGAVGYPTFFLFLGYRFIDPLHLAVAVGFFPLWLLGVFGRRQAPTWRMPITVDASERTRALYAQLMMVAIAIGVFVSGFYIMFIGLTDVLIPSDRVFLDDSQKFFVGQLDGRLIRFVAHDRAGFGGALASLGAGLLATAMWGWRSGERSTWWCLLGASVVGFGAALSVHLAVGYTDVLHLLPFYVGIVWMTVVLTLSRPWFFRRV